MGDSANPADPSWAPYTFGSAPDAAPTVTPASGAYSLSYTTNPAKPFVQLKFKVDDGTYWPIVTASDVTIWPKETPPGILTVSLTVPTRTQSTGTGAAAGPIAGTVLDGTLAPRPGVEVRMFASSGAIESLVSTVVSALNGAFVVDPRGAVRVRLEFGPAEAPYELISGTAAWTNTTPPSDLRYILDLPAVSPPASSGTIVVSGIVRHTDGTVLPASLAGGLPAEEARPAIRLQVVTRAIGASETPSGAPLSPGSDGGYSTTVAAGVDFQVVCQLEVSAGVWEEAGRSALVAAPPGPVVVDVVVSDDRLGTRSDAGTLKAMDDALTAAGVTDPDTISAGDEEILAQKLSLPIEKVRCRSAAKKLRKAINALASAPDIHIEVYYGLLCLRFPPKPRDFARRVADRARVEAALRDGVARQLLRARWLDEPGLTSLLDKLTSLAALYDKSLLLGDTLASYVRAASAPAQLADAQVTTFVARWYQRTGPTQFWSDLRTNLPGGWSTTQVDASLRAMRLIDLTGRSKATVAAFQSAYPNAPESYAAEIGIVGWTTITGGLADADIPKRIRGATLAERRAGWAEFLFRRAERRYKWAAVRGDMLRELVGPTPTLGGVDFTSVVAFVTAQRRTVWHAALPVEFDLGESHVATFAPAPAALPLLQALQRLYALIPSRDGWTVLKALWLAGFRSARDVSRIGAGRFVTKLDAASPGAVAAELARLIWRRARRRNQRAGSVWRAAHPERPRSHSPFTLPAPTPSGALQIVAKEVKPAAIAEVSALYTQALCGCEHCQSVLSPSAYFVDTLFWLKARDALAPLLELRPDLEKLELDCENTETLLPYADLVMEILEQVAVDAALADLPHSTEGESEELLVYPEHVDRTVSNQAYELGAVGRAALKKAHFARVLPYHLALDEVQRYLGAAGVPHLDVVDAFNDLAPPVSGGPPVTPLQRAVLALGGTVAGATALTDGGPRLTEGGTVLPELWWGYTAATPNARNELYRLSKADPPGLMERGQISDFELILDLMRTRYLNADARLGVVLDPAAAVDGCDAVNLILMRDRQTYPEPLPDPAPAPIFVIPDAWLFARMAALLRLLDWTRWTPLEVDKALYALGVGGAAPGTALEGVYTLGVQITAERLIGLDAIRELRAATGLSAGEIGSWWTGLDLYRDRENRSGRPVAPLYDERFLDPLVVGTDGAGAFALNATRTELAAVNAGQSPVATFPVPLAGALRVSVSELQAVEVFVNARIPGSVGTNLAGLWHLFRWTSLARACGLTIAQVDAWILASGIEPFVDTPTPAPANALSFVSSHEELREHGLTASSVGWIFGHLATEVSAWAPVDAVIEALLGEIQAGLVALTNELVPSAADEPTLRAALAEIGLAEDAIDDLVAIAVWEDAVGVDYGATMALLIPWVDDHAALLAAVPAAPVDPDADARLAAMLLRLRAATLIRRKREHVITTLGARFPALTAPHAELLDTVVFTKLTDFTNPLAALHQTAGGYSLETAVDLTPVGSARAYEAVHIAAKVAHLVGALRLDVDALAEWLTDASRLGIPALTALPVTEDRPAMAGVWSTLKPALRYYALGAVDHPALRTTGPSVRQALRAGLARTMLTGAAATTGWDVGLAGGLAVAMGAGSVTVEGAGTAPAAVTVQIDGVTVTAAIAPGEGIGHLLLAIRSAVLAAGTALAHVTATTQNSVGTSTLDPLQIVRLSLTTVDAAHAPFDVVAPGLAVKAWLYDAARLDLFLRRWSILATLRVDVEAVLPLVTADPSRTLAAEVRRIARAKSPSDAAWTAIGHPVRDEIRKRQRDALYAYVRALPSGPNSEAEFYATYFVDAGMEPVMTTTRLALAISSVQTYVNRVLLGKVTFVPVVPEGEPPADPEVVVLLAEDEAEWRGWRSSYRMWEAARKVYLFPENWLHPSLRVEKSAEFEALESALYSEGLDAKGAEEAHKAYLASILQYGNPLLAGMTTAADGSLHFVARTGGKRDQLIYRSATPIVTDRWRWGAWETVPFPVPYGFDTRLAMYQQLGTTFLTWTQVVSQRQEVDKGPATYESTVRISFSVRTGTGWSAPQEASVIVETAATDPVKDVHLLLYEHVPAAGETAVIGGGLYLTCQYRVGTDEAEVDKFGAVALYWSPTLRRFLEHADASALLGSTGGQFAEYGASVVAPGNSTDGQLVARQDQSVAGTGGLQNRGDSRYSAEVADSYQLVDGPDGFAPLQVYRVNTLVSETIVSRLVSGIETPELTHESVVVETTSEEGFLVLPQNFAWWGSRAPFAIALQARSYLVLPEVSAQYDLADFSQGFGGGTQSGGATWRTQQGTVFVDARESQAPEVTEWDGSYVCVPLHHAYLDTLALDLDGSGLTGMYGAGEDEPLLHQGGESLWSREPWDAVATSNSRLHSLDPATIDEEAPSDLVAFSTWAPHRLYNWELFVHVPLRIAQALCDQGHYPDALRWLHLVVNPSLVSAPFSQAPTEAVPVGEAWLPRPLWDPGTFIDTALKDELAAANPFDVHALAECDPVVYRYAVARQYVETLIAWGDSLFSADSAEAIAEATQLYVYGIEFLGPRPIEVSLKTGRGSGLTFEQLTLDAAGEVHPLDGLENLLTTEVAGEPTVRLDVNAVPESAAVGYFCEPRNDRSMQLWDTLEDRLFKIRNSMNIDGVVRTLAPFEPPIDPGALVAGAAAGLSGAQLRPTRWVSPHVRFGAMLSMAKGLAGSVQRLSGALLQALQSKDAEAIGLLRQEQEIELLRRVGDVRRMQIEQARLERAALRESRNVVKKRLDHYERLLDVRILPEEILEEELLAYTALVTAIVETGKATAAAAAWAPEVTAGVCSGAEFGKQPSESATKAADGSQAFIAGLNYAAQLAGRSANRKRRTQDWQLQQKLAAAELVQIDAQLDSAKQRVDIAKAELENHRKQVEHARQMDTQLRTKFTNEQLYGWMIGQLTSLHSASYQLALEVARKAEVCFRRELGLAASNYVRGDHWNASRKGLLAGDKLMADLERMEVAFVELDRRELEVTKHVSLQRLDPAALLALKTLGTCTFSLPEVLFDLDFPGHYLRRIKGVTVSMPSVTGPYEGMNATLTLTRSEVRMDPSPTDPEDYRLAARVPERWSERVALSSGQQDGGLFTFDVRDAKYLPFEHRGVISDWSLELAGAEGTPARPQFDWNSISDVVFHVRYTARYETGLKAAARGSVGLALEVMREDDLPLQLGISFRQDAPDEWAAFVKTLGSANPTISLPFIRDRFPYMIDALSPKVKGGRVLLRCAAGVTGAASLVEVGINSTSTPDQPAGGTTVMAGNPTAVFAYTGTYAANYPGAGATQRLSVKLTGLSGVLDVDGFIDPRLLLDVWVLLDLDFGDFTP